MPDRLPRTQCAKKTLLDSSHSVNFRLQNRECKARRVEICAVNKPRLINGAQLTGRGGSGYGGER